MYDLFFRHLDYLNLVNNNVWVKIRSSFGFSFQIIVTFYHKKHINSNFTFICYVFLVINVTIIRKKSWRRHVPKHWYIIFLNYISALIIICIMKLQSNWVITRTQYNVQILAFQMKSFFFYINCLIYRGKTRQWFKAGNCRP